jgi:ribonuclease HI
MSNKVSTIKAMIEAIPDGNANMRQSVQFFVDSNDMMELIPWLNEWNKTKEGKFNGRWGFLPHLKKDFILYLRATGM